MTEHDERAERAERAFRDAFAARGAEAPHAPLDVPAGARRRTWLVAGAAAAAVIAAVAVPVALLGGEGERRVEPALDDPTETTAAPFEPRWVSHRGTEVAVPADWSFDYGPVRPDCIQVDNNIQDDPWADGTPTAPYVEVAPESRAVPAIGCDPARAGRGPDAFGDLPVALWQPHVLLAKPDFAGEQGEWKYQGWTLTRQTIGAASITVLSAPGDGMLGEQILGTASEVGIDDNGCATNSPAQETTFQRPTVAIPVPDPDVVDLVAVCQYVRGDTDIPGLLASRQLIGAEAQDLARAIRDAPRGGGPDRPQNCVHDMYGDLAIVLRFLPTDWTARDVAYPEAYVYYDWCFGNGIFDGTAGYQLTKGNCQALFTEAPIRIWSASSAVVDACWR